MVFLDFEIIFLKAPVKWTTPYQYKGVVLKFPINDRPVTANDRVTVSKQ